MLGENLAGCDALEEFAKRVKATPATQTWCVFLSSAEAKLAEGAGRTLAHVKGGRQGGLRVDATVVGQTTGFSASKERKKRNGSHVRAFAL